MRKLLPWIASLGTLCALVTPVHAEITDAALIAKLQQQIQILQQIINAYIQLFALQGKSIPTISTTSPTESSTPAVSDTTPPKISMINWTVSQTEGIVTWQTDQAATSQIFYGQSSIVDLNHSSMIYDPERGMSHAMKLSNLSPNTTYYFILRSQNTSNVEALSTTQSLKTNTPDGIPPEIYSYSASAITDKTATIEWDANEPTTGAVYYDTTIDPAVSPRKADNNLSIHHSIAIMDLIPNTIYQFMIEASDSYHNTTRTLITRFTTLKDTTPAQISNIQTASPSSNSRTISWQTDEKTTSTLYYSTTPNLSYYAGPGVTSVTDNHTDTTHSVTISLSPNTIYYLRIQARDLSNNVTDSSEFSLKTQ